MCVVIIYIFDVYNSIHTIQPNIYPVALTLVCLTSSYICATQTVGVRREILFWGGFCIAGLIETQTTFLITNPTFSSPILAKSCRMYYMESQRCMYSFRYGLCCVYQVCEYIFVYLYIECACKMYWEAWINIWNLTEWCPVCEAVYTDVFMHGYSVYIFTYCW